MLLAKKANRKAAYSKVQIEASIYKDSFYDFLRAAWSIIIPEEPVWNWHIKYLCRRMQRIAERVMRGVAKKSDLIINIPPGTTKSTIVSVMFPAWVWTKMPSAKFICGSYAFTLAMELARKSRDIIKSAWYRTHFPHVEIRQDQDSKEFFVNSMGGARRSIGSGGAIIGFHAHFILIDDPIDPQSAVSEAEMREVNRWINETLSQRKVDKLLTVTVLIMQRLHQDDPTADKLNKDPDVSHICLPGEDSELVKPARLRKKYKFGLLDPTRLSKRILKNAKRDLGQYAYAGQYDQNPTPAGGGMFKVDRIEIGLPPDKFRRIVRYWDKAIAVSKGAAFTVGVLMGEDFEGRYWIVDVVRGRWNSSRREKIIKHTAERDYGHFGKLVLIGVEIEPGSGGVESAENTVKNLRGFRVSPNRPSGDKITRADPFSVQVNAGNVFMKKAGWNKELTEELRFFPFSKYKDQVDGSSGAFTLLTKPRLKAGAI
jgi:predicted phage terminase large subunit-like protein